MEFKGRCVFTLIGAKSNKVYKTYNINDITISEFGNIISDMHKEAKLIEKKMKRQKEKIVVHQNSDFTIDAPQDLTKQDLDKIVSECKQIGTVDSVIEE